MASRDFVRSRVDGLLAQPVDDELVIYDPDTEHAHVLNPLAYAIWEHARDGATIAELTPLAPGGDEAAVRLAIADLDEAGLLADTPDIAPPGMSRRALIRRLGIAAVAAPFVTTILTESPAAAALGDPCGVSGTATCGTGFTCVNSVCHRTCGNDAACGHTGGGQCGANATDCCCSTGSNKYCHRSGAFC